MEIIDSGLYDLPAGEAGKLSGLGEIRFFFLKGSQKPVACRVGSSDETLVDSIFREEEYALETGWQDWKPRLIIDGGANVGYASLYFAQQYPSAQIIAVEPDDDNFKILEYNTEAYPKIKCFHAGLGKEDSWLRVKDAGRGAWGMITESASEKDEHALRAMSIDTILASSGYKSIDLLKIDIEGAEKEIFSSNYESWLPYVKVIEIELHDRWKPGCSKAFFSAVSRFDFTFSIRGENCILVNNAFEDSHRNSVEFTRNARLRNRLERYVSYFRDFAVHNKQAYMEEYFKKNNIKHVALYGLTEISRGLIPVLKNMGLVIDYAVEEYRIDKETKVISRKAKEFPTTDCMIICDLRVSVVRKKLKEMNVDFRISDLYEVVGDKSEYDERNLY